MTYPEPERCRRTDGKKWRCGKNVVPGRKYCERHMHRGRLRSRKPVEGSQNPFPGKIPLSSPVKNSENFSSNLIAGSPLLKSAFLDKTRASPCQVSGNVDAKTTVADAGHKKSITIRTSRTVNDHEDSQTAIVPSAVHLDASSTSTIRSRKCSEFDDGKSKCSISVGCKNINNRRFMRNVGSNTYQGLEFSPKSILQAKGCFRSHLHLRDLELEPARCRRTDGKKWRCRQDALANQKYCRVHMHRGVKKHSDASQPSAFPITTRVVSSSGRRRPIETLRNRVDSGALNTSLCISILASPLLGVNYDGSTSSSSSATTISDTLVAA